MTLRTSNHKSCSISIRYSSRLVWHLEIQRQFSKPKLCSCISRLLLLFENFVHREANLISFVLHNQINLFFIHPDTTPKRLKSHHANNLYANVDAYKWRLLTGGAKVGMEKHKERTMINWSRTSKRNHYQREQPATCLTMRNTWTQVVFS